MENIKPVIGVNNPCGKTLPRRIKPDEYLTYHQIKIR
jgi:hypothetical protein